MTEEPEEEIVAAAPPSLDDDCPVCRHRVLGHPRTLAPVEGVSGHYEWAFRLCNGVIVKAISELRGR